MEWCWTDGPAGACSAVNGNCWGNGVSNSKTYTQCQHCSDSACYKKLRKRLAMPKLVDYNFNYYRPSAEFVMRRSVKGWLTEKQEVQATKLERLKAKGKGPPKKGQGKRTKKKKR